MKLVLQTLLEELNRLKGEGVGTIPVSDASLDALRKVVDARTLQAINQEPAKAPKEAALAPLPAPSPTPTRTTAPTGSVPDTVSAAPSAVRAAETGPTGLEAYLSGKESPKPAASPTHASHTRKLPPPPDLTLPPGSKAERLAWLEKQLLNDALWKLHARPDTQPLLDHRHPDAPILFLGDAPSEEEITAGEAFVNPPGQLYLKIMQAMGLNRDGVILAHALPWKPLGPIDPATGKAAHREPTSEEIHYCQPFLSALVDTLQPRLIVALGAVAGKSLFGTTAFKALTEIKGQWKEFHGIPTLVSFHPNYLLLKESESKAAEKKAKRAAWEDMLKVMEQLGLPISDRQRGFFL